MVHSEQAAAQAHRSVLVNSLQRGSDTSADLQSTVEAVLSRQSVRYHRGRSINYVKLLSCKGPLQSPRRLGKATFNTAVRRTRNAYLHQQFQRRNTTGKRMIEHLLPSMHYSPRCCQSWCKLANLGCFGLRKRVRRMNRPEAVSGVSYNMLNYFCVSR